MVLIKQSNLHNQSSQTCNCSTAPQLPKYTGNDDRDLGINCREMQTKKRGAPTQIETESCLIANT